MVDNRDGRAILFSGHMIDAAGRDPPRFPPALEPAAKRAIRAALDRMGVGSGDVAISSAACGGDLLFAEAAIARAAPIRIYLPFDEPTFVEKSVAFAGEAWVSRYRAVVTKAAATLVATDVLGPVRGAEDPYERTNVWMLDEAERIAGGRVSFICLWNGEGGDGPGGTKHMIEAVRERGGHVDWIDIRKL